MVLSRAFLQLRPIVAALSRHKVATLLIVLQVALTLAVASNALFIVAMRIIHLSRPTSTDDAHIFVIRNGWKLGQTAGQIDANIRADLETLRHVTGVRDAFSSQAYPLAGYSPNVVLRLKLKPDQKTSPQLATFFASDEQAIDTLGLSLVAGRNFRPDEISAIGPDDKMSPPVVIVTRSLADKLFHDGSALGKTIYLPNGPAVIVGILANLQGPLKESDTLSFYSVLVPTHYLDPLDVVYLVRTDATPITSVITATLKALQERGGVRIIDPGEGVVTMAQARERLCTRS